MVYARVSKTRGCNDLESSSLSPGTSFFDPFRLSCFCTSHESKIYF